MVETSAKTRLLIIGYGNTLRGDDAAGPRVALAFEEMGVQGVHALSLPLLAPEVAEPVSRAERVLFVDASATPSSRVQIQQLTASETCQVMAHAASPATILALARDVFGHCPESYIITVPAEDFSPGEALSPAAVKGISEAVKLIETRFISGRPSRQGA